MKNKKKIITLFVLWAVWLGVTFYFLTQPGDESSRASGFVTELFLRIFPRLRGDAEMTEYVIRKIAHFGSYTGSGLIGMITLSQTDLHNVFVILVPIHVCLAALSEILQLFSVGRCCSVIDMGIDFIGACFGIAIATLILRLVDRRRSKTYRGGTD